MSTKIFSIALPEDIFEKVQLQARKDGLSRASWIRSKVIEALEWERMKKEASA